MCSAVRGVALSLEAVFLLTMLIVVSTAVVFSMLYEHNPRLLHPSNFGVSAPKLVGFYLVSMRDLEDSKRATILALGKEYGFEHLFLNITVYEINESGSLTLVSNEEQGDMELASAMHLFHYYALYFHPIDDLERMQVNISVIEIECVGLR